MSQSSTLQLFSILRIAKKTPRYFRACKSVCSNQRLNPVISCRFLRSKQRLGGYRLRNAPLN